MKVLRKTRKLVGSGRSGSFRGLEGPEAQQGLEWSLDPEGPRGSECLEGSGGPGNLEVINNTVQKDKNFYIVNTLNIQLAQTQTTVHKKILY